MIRLLSCFFPRQIHPVCEDKAQLVAYDGDVPEALPIAPPAYPLAPNICVEGGRIEFIKPPLDSSLNVEYIKSPPEHAAVGVATPQSEKTDVAKVRMRHLYFPCRFRFRINYLLTLSCALFL